MQDRRKVHRVELTDPGAVEPRVDEVDAPLRPLSHSREAVRVEAPRRPPIQVVILGPRDLRETATVRDLSFTGIGVELEVAAERRIGTITQVELRLPLPGHTRPVAVPAAIRRRQLTGRTRMIIGLIFLLPPSAAATQKAIDDYVMVLQRKRLTTTLQVRGDTDQ